MKRKTWVGMASLLAVTLLGVAGVQARTWTSADGAKTFEGELKSYPELEVNETAAVTTLA
jgi:hypothetical protein